VTGRGRERKERGEEEEGKGEVDIAWPDL